MASVYAQLKRLAQSDAATAAGALMMTFLMTLGLSSIVMIKTGAAMGWAFALAILLTVWVWVIYAYGASIERQPT